MSRTGRRPPRIAVGYDEYESATEDGTVSFRVGCAVDDQDVAGGPAVRLIELPGAEVASAVLVSSPLPDFLSPVTPRRPSPCRSQLPSKISVLVNDTIALIQGPRPSHTQLSTSAGSGSEVVTDPATEQELIGRIEANVAA